MSTTPRTRLDPDVRRGQILDIAAPIFRDQPYSAVSLDSIATEAGVTRGLLHHYFGSKRAMYLAVLERAVRVPASVRLVPEGVEGGLREVVPICVASWMQMIRQAGGLWSGSSSSGGFAERDIDAVIASARDDLVERMIDDELPFPSELDRDMLRSALRAYASLARVASDEWLVQGTLTTEQTAALLEGSLLALIEIVVPDMGSVDLTGGDPSLLASRQ